MQLSIREWGGGDRTALLVHGIMSDSRTWRRVGPALADLGYRVVAVDLRGHGGSPRGPYSPELFADDLVDTLPEGADVAIGHSLGGLALSLAVGRLRPRRAVYSDPAWSSARPGQDVDPAVFAAARHRTRAEVVGISPHWDPADIDVELATLKAWDPETSRFLGGRPLRDFLPAEPVVPSLVQLADPSFLTGPQDAALLRTRGFEVRTVTGAGHTIFRDDFDGFMASLGGWI
ncbi:alpha/beta fold hydrolase [Streptomyces yaanensis]|uniref:Alpha/beta fold hydrolase n=1 Tax=Streptomyces yaanensis TaxID=1142239 RepID=A0ABV7S8N4_9ACTN|nr:alpha/beta hydrolase [Streptomyces sp. CGMCC 4.7035]WNC00244.1 alpha/beta hydrolase [Streptomyces sp. CGMCC 4.7035]